MRIGLSNVAFMARVGGVTDLLVRVRPDLDLLLALFVVDDHPVSVPGLDLGGLPLVLVQDRRLPRRRRRRRRSRSSDPERVA